MRRAWLLLFALACGDQPDPGYLVIKPRILGNFIRVVGDEARTDARPGESVDYELVITAPDAIPDTTWVFVACRPAPTSFGAGFCEGAPDAFFASTAPSPDPPRIRVDVPEDYTQDSIFLLGRVCFGGAVRTDLDATDPEMALQACEGEGTGVTVTTSIPVELEVVDVNHQPGIAEVTLDDVPWEAELVGDRGPCAGLGWPEFHFGSPDDFVIAISATDGSREEYEGLQEGEIARVLEDLQLSFFATELGLERRFSFISDTQDRANLEYTAEEVEGAPPAEGRAIRFDFVMRDGRGGIDRISRAACLLP